MVFIKQICYVSILSLFVCSLISRNVIVEFKGAYFLATGDTFKKVYGKHGALYGPELTAQLCEDDNWYAFASIDYLHKKGHSLGLCNPTTVSLVPLAFGLKYLIPTGDNCTDFYIGLGFQAVNVRTTNCSDFVLFRQSQWGYGGIAKVGAYYYLPCNFLLDFFIDYSFVRVGSCRNACKNAAAGVQSLKTSVSGAIFGIGLGYQF